MHSITRHPSAERERRTEEPAREVERLEAELDAARAVLATLREELHRFKIRYTQTVGGRLAELAEVEGRIREAEASRLGSVNASEEAEAHRESDEADGAVLEASTPFKRTLRKLFWSVAKVFHPDHAADEEEARRRHTIMAEASRAYREGDMESLHTLLDDERLASLCVNTATADERVDMSSLLLKLREDLRTVEFGIKRLRQDGMYRIKQSVDEEAAQGRDALAQMAARLDRQITKARHRLEHLS